VGSFLVSDFALETTLRDLHERGFIHGADMHVMGPVLDELVRLGYAKPRSMIASAAVVLLAGAGEPERAMEIAKGMIESADKPNPFGHSPLHDLTEKGFLFLEARPPAPPHCGQIRRWTIYCHGQGRCACHCVGCEKARHEEKH
jgi:hypothetical protein